MSNPESKPAECDDGMEAYAAALYQSALGHNEDCGFYFWTGRGYQHFPLEDTLPPPEEE